MTFSVRGNPRRGVSESLFNLFLELGCPGVRRSLLTVGIAVGRSKTHSHGACVTGHSVADLGWELASEIKVSDCEQNNMQMTNMQPGLAGSPKLDCLDSNVVVDAGKSAGGTMAMKVVMATVMLIVTEKKNVAMHVMVKGEHNDAAD